MASEFEVRLLQRIRLRFQESTKLTPPIATLATARKALPKRYCPLIEQELHILRFVALVLVSASIPALRVARALQWFGAVDEADIEDAGEWLHVRYDEGAVLWGRLIGRDELCELREAESGQDCGDVGVVTEIKVEDLGGREGGLHTGKCHCEVYCQLCALLRKEFMD